MSEIKIESAFFKAETGSAKQELLALIDKYSCQPITNAIKQLISDEFFRWQEVHRLRELQYTIKFENDCFYFVPVREIDNYALKGILSGE